MKQVRPHGENLSIITVLGNEVVANRLEDGSFRWEVGEVCVYVPENSIIPEDVIKERGYWNDEKNKGLLGGSKGNRVKMQRFAGHESRGLLFKVDEQFEGQAGSVSFWLHRGKGSITVNLGQDVTIFLGITEYVPEQ